MISALDGVFLALAACLAMALVNLASLALAASASGAACPLDLPDGAAVSLVRPVCGLERFSEETLESGFRLATATTN